MQGATILLLSAVGIFVLLIIGLLIWWMVVLLSSPKSSTSPSPSPSSPSSPYTPPPQTSQLRVINSAQEDIWVVATCGPCGTPFPGLATTDILVIAGGYYDFNIPNEGLVGARIFAKKGCDNQGNNCLIGDSLPVYTGPPCPAVTGCTGECVGGPCASTPCQPPINSLVEFTFGCVSGTCNIETNTTSFDTSNVDGYTFPFTLQVVGSLENCSDNPNIDGRKLDLAKCPTNIDLSYGGVSSLRLADGNIVDLTSVDLRYFSPSGKLVGCYSPCQVLTSKYQLAASAMPAQAYCCPTPPVSSQECQAGPAANNLYTQAVRSMVANSYTYAYDDSNSLSSCQAGTVKYLMTFLPLNSLL